MGNNLSRRLLCCTHSCPTHLVTPWTVACHVSLSMEFSRQEYWTGLPFPTPEDLPDPGIKPVSLASPALAVDSLPLRHLGSPFQTFGLLKLVINLGFGSNSECKVFFRLFIYLFLVTLCLHCCIQTFSSCTEQWLLWLGATGSRRRGFSSCGL